MTDTPLRFGPFEIDPRTLELRRDGSLLPLEPRPARLLVRLASEPGLLVTRQELRELGWPKLPGAAEKSLNTCIHQIRSALAESGPLAAEVQTLRGRGYRLSVSVEDPKAPPWREASRRVAGSGRGRIALATLGGAGLAALWVVSTVPTTLAPPLEAKQLVAQARYLADETLDIGAAMAVLDSGLTAFPQVGGIHAERGDLSFMVGDLEGARRRARAALELDPDLATAHRTQGGLAMMRGDWSLADQSFSKARQLDPGDTRTLMAHAYLRTVERRFEDAADLVQEALRVDPLSASIHQDAGYMYLLMEKYTEASRYCEEALRFRPRSTWAMECLFDASELLGKGEEAAGWGQVLLEHYGGQLTPTDAAAEITQRVKSRRVTRWIAAVEGGANPFGLAVAYAGSGLTAEAIEALENALTAPHPGVLSLAVDPRLAPLRPHPAFQALARRLDLPA